MIGSGSKLGKIQNPDPNSTYFRTRDTGNNEEFGWDPRLEFTASKADNPVDMYFLFDLSGSMGDKKKQLAIIAQRLAEVRIKYILVIVM